MGLTNQVSLLGYRTDIRQLNHAADLFVFPSLREGLGLAGLDAVVDGTYILGGKFGGIKDYIVDHSVGRLINPNDEIQIAALIRERMGKNSDDLSQYVINELTKFDTSSVDNVMKSSLSTIQCLIVFKPLNGGSKAFFYRRCQCAYYVN